MGEIIRRVNGYDQNAYTYYPIIIVGAGASGIATACRLKSELGFDQFRVFERQSGIGGTWWSNRADKCRKAAATDEAAVIYQSLNPLHGVLRTRTSVSQEIDPGQIELMSSSDVPAAFYSFSFAQNPNWTSFHPPGREIVQYYHEVLSKYQITDKFEVNTDIDRCRWLEDEQLYEVTLRRFISGMGDLSTKDRAKIIKERGEDAVYSETEIVRAKIVVSCAGGLVEPKAWPEEIPGIEKFKGPVFHSARWNDKVDFTDKNVVVVGTGCSSAQLVPRLPNAPYNAKRVTQLMRSPPWVAPAAAPPGGDEWWEKHGPALMKNIPGLLQAIRTGLFIFTESQWFSLFPIASERGRKAYETKILAGMKKIVPEKYHEIMTPNYGVGCKRRIFDKRWLKSLNDPRIELTTQPLSRVIENGVVIGPGVVYPPDAKREYPEREVPADIIVLAHGFDTTKWLHPLRVQGKGSKDLVETMEERGGAQAYQGTAMDGFPNFFMIFGPNTATGHSSVVMASENMIMYALQFIKPILRGEVTSVDVKHEAEIAFTNEIQKSLKNTVWMSGGCSSWYFTKDGWNSTVYPYSQIDFWWRCLFPKWNDWNIVYTKKGLARRQTRRVFRVLTVALAVAGLYRIHRSGISLSNIRGRTRETLLIASDIVTNNLKRFKA